jgi:hypothetical protein
MVELNNHENSLSNTPPTRNNTVSFLPTACENGPAEYLGKGNQASSSVRMRWLAQATTNGTTASKSCLMHPTPSTGSQPHEVGQEIAQYTRF